MARGVVSTVAWSDPLCTNMHVNSQLTVAVRETKLFAVHS